MINNPNRLLSFAILFLIVSMILMLTIPGYPQNQSLEKLESKRAIAKVQTLFNGTLTVAENDSSDTTAWISLVPYQYTTNPYETGDPRYWTAFLHTDTENSVLFAKWEIALFDSIYSDTDTTLRPYTPDDNSHFLIEQESAISDTLGHVYQLLIPGGNYLRFILQTEITSDVRLDLWQKH